MSERYQPALLAHPAWEPTHPAWERWTTAATVLLHNAYLGPILETLASIYQSINQTDSCCTTTTLNHPTEPQLLSCSTLPQQYVLVLGPGSCVLIGDDASSAEPHWIPSNPAAMKSILSTSPLINIPTMPPHPGNISVECVVTVASTFTCCSYSYGSFVPMNLERGEVGIQAPRCGVRSL